MFFSLKRTLYMFFFVIVGYLNFEHAGFFFKWWEKTWEIPFVSLGRSRGMWRKMVSVFLLFRTRSGNSLCRVSGKSLQIAASILSGLNCQLRNVRNAHRLWEFGGNFLMMNSDRRFGKFSWTLWKIITPAQVDYIPVSEIPKIFSLPK